MVNRRKQKDIPPLKVIRHKDNQHSHQVSVEDHNHEMIFPPVFEENKLVQPAIYENDDFKYSPRGSSPKSRHSNDYKSYHSIGNKSYHTIGNKSHHTIDNKSHHTIDNKSHRSTEHKHKSNKGHKESKDSRGPRGHRGHHGPTGSTGPRGPTGPAGNTGNAPIIVYSGSDTLIIPADETGPFTNTYSVGFAGTNGLNRTSSTFINAEPGDIAFRAPRNGTINNFWYELEGTGLSTSFSNINITTKLYTATPSGSPGTIQTRVVPSGGILTNNNVSGTFGLNHVIFNSTSPSILVSQGDFVLLALIFSATLTTSSGSNTDVSFNFHAGFTFA